VLGAGAYLLWRYSHAPIQAWVTVVTAPLAVLLPVLLLIWRRLRAWHRLGMGLATRARSYLEQRRRQARLDAEQATARLLEIDAAERLSQLLVQRADPAAYAPHRGLLGQVHRDLTELSIALAEAQRQWDTLAANPLPVPASSRWWTAWHRRRAQTMPDPVPGPPLQRIVLYIDDLDRCPPQRVVEVLAAVHLMLALPLFVVVVAVDPRWLLSCLAHHYRDLFAASTAASTAAAAAAAGADADGGLADQVATPLDYLDKIFQVPFAVAPMHPATANRYLAALLAPEPGTTLLAARSGREPVPVHDPAEPVDDSGPAAPALAQRDGEDNLADARSLGLTTGSEPQPGQPPTFAATRTRLTQRSGQPDGSTPHPAPHIGTGALRTVPDLRPPGLALAAEEIAFLAQLGPLLPTPRAAKKLVNLYRLVRIAIPDTELGSFTTEGTYRVVQILLAILVGAPTQSAAIFTEIREADPDADLTTVFRTDNTDPVRGKLSRLLTAIRYEQPSWSGTAQGFQPWCPRLARYSFHTRDLTAVWLDEHPDPPNPFP
jgi:hypothetical protein